VPNDIVIWKKWEKWEQGKRIRPRLAVVLDYLWYQGDCKAFLDGLHKTYSRNESSSGDFYFFLSPAFKKVFQGRHPFQTITLVAMAKKKDNKSQDVPINFAYLPMTVSEWERLSTGFPGYKANAFTATYGSGSLKEFRNKVGDPKNALRHFLSIKLRDMPELGITAVNYDLESPWCFPVTIGGNYHQIQRPEKREGGELPNRDWYLKYGEGEYGNPTGLQ